MHKQRAEFWCAKLFTPYFCIVWNSYHERKFQIRRTPSWHYCIVTVPDDGQKQRRSSNLSKTPSGNSKTIQHSTILPVPDIQSNREHNRIGNGSLRTDVIHGDTTIPTPDHEHFCCMYISLESRIFKTLHFLSIMTYYKFRCKVWGDEMSWLENKQHNTT